jgi:hypothetical protein
MTTHVHDVFTPQMVFNEVAAKKFNNQFACVLRRATPENISLLCPSEEIDIFISTKFHCRVRVFSALVNTLACLPSPMVVLASDLPIQNTYSVLQALYKISGDKINDELFVIAILEKIKTI